MLNVRSSGDKMGHFYVGPVCFGGSNLMLKCRVILRDFP